MTGLTVALALEALALVYLVLNQGLSHGVARTWWFTVLLLGLLPPMTVGLAFITDRHWALRLLLAEALLVFWANFPEGGLLPARWLIFSALIAQACTVLPARWHLGVGTLLVAELLVVQYGLPGMSEDVPEAGPMALVLACLVLPGVLLHLLQAAGEALEVVRLRNEGLHASVLQLTNANTEFLEQANTAGEESAVEERHRITRDLHDVVGQTLTNIIMMMDAALHRRAQDPEETVKLLRWIRKQAQTGLEETRAVLYELRALRPAPLRGLRALKKLTDTFAKLSRIKVAVEWGNLPWTFDPAQEQAVYHLVQGSLSNAFRHGSATRIDLHFQVDRGLLQVMIRDNGRGGPDSASGLGQHGMEERLARRGGTVEFRSEAYGYVVSARLPLEEAPVGTS